MSRSCKCQSLGGLLSDGFGVSSKKGLNLNSVRWVSNKGGELFNHLLFAEFHICVKLFPELFLVWLSSLFVDGDVVESKFLHNSAGSLVCAVVLQMGELTESAIDV